MGSHPHREILVTISRSRTELEPDGNPNMFKVTGVSQKIIHPPWVGSLNPVDGSEIRQKPVEVGSSLSGVHQLKLVGFLEIQRPVDLSRKIKAARAPGGNQYFDPAWYHLWRIVSEKKIGTKLQN